MRVICALVFLNSCTTIRKTSHPSIVDFDDVGFFTDENKPDTYQLKYPQYSPSSVSVNDRDDVVSGEKGAIAQTELKIREHAVTYGYNGVILGKLSHYTVVNGHDTSPVTYYTQTYIPIIYDQEKYQAPLTDYQRLKEKRLSSVPQADLLSIHNEYNTNGHEYVDLGLSVLWATRNVGADKPEDIGSYYSWGETVPKKEYAWSTYKYSKNDKGKKFSKYVYRMWNGNKDRKNTLDLSDDAANINMQKKWRIPTSQELKELLENCRWVLESMNGVKGYRVYSNQNNNTIFIPFTGMYVDNEIIDFSNYGAYWTSSLQPHGDLFHSGSSTAKVFVLSEKDIESEGVLSGVCERFIGLTIRPVWDPNMPD